MFKGNGKMDKEWQEMLIGDAAPSTPAEAPKQGGMDDDNVPF